MYKKKWTCEKCGYETNKKQNYETHIGRQAACEKRLSRMNNENDRQNATLAGQNATLMGQNATLQSNNEFNCSSCNKRLSCFKSLNRHLKICKGVNSLQCPTCKRTFSNSGSKSRHMKNVKCELVLTEEQQRIVELEEELKEKNKQLEEARARPTTVIHNNTINNTLNYFNDPSVNYNNYDNLDYGHITKGVFMKVFEECKSAPMFIEELTRLALEPRENRVMLLLDGHRSNRSLVYKDEKEKSKILKDVLDDCLVQTSMFSKKTLKSLHKEGFLNALNGKQNEIISFIQNACETKLSSELKEEFIEECYARLKCLLLDVWEDFRKNVGNIL